MLYSYWVLYRRRLPFETNRILVSERHTSGILPGGRQVKNSVQGLIYPLVTMLAPLLGFHHRLVLSLPVCSPYYMRTQLLHEDPEECEASFFFSAFSFASCLGKRWRSRWSSRQWRWSPRFFTLFSKVSIGGIELRFVHNSYFSLSSAQFIYRSHTCWRPNKAAYNVLSNLLRLGDHSKFCADAVVCYIKIFILLDSIFHSSVKGLKIPLFFSTGGPKNRIHSVFNHSVYLTPQPNFSIPECSRVDQDLPF